MTFSRFALFPLAIGTLVHDYSCDACREEEKYSRNDTSTVKGGIESFQRKVIEMCGYYLPIVADAKEETEKEILFGKTKRLDVDTDSLGKYGYSITTEGEKIVFATNDNDFTFIKALEKVLVGMERGSVELFSGKLEVSDAPILTSMCFSDVHNNFA